MAKEVLMPKLSSTMTHGSVTQWFKEEGDSVEVGEPIYEVMTDKIAIEVESYDAGILLKRYVDVNEEVPVNSVIAYIGKEDESVPDKPPVLEADEEKITELLPDASADPEPQKQSEPEPETEAIVHQRPRATPSARRLAKINNIDLRKVSGSGKNHRIHLSDVENYKPQAQTSSPSVQRASQQEQLIAWSGMRKVIADKMSFSKQTIPHVTMNAPANADQLLDLRRQLLDVIEQESSVRITITDLIAYIVSRILKDHPMLNATTSDKGIHIQPSVNLGLAVALEQGLMVPVIHDANELSLAEIAQKAKVLAEKAKKGSLVPDEMKNGTFTISAIGKGSVVDFNPIINYPEVGILGVGAIHKELIFKNGVAAEVSKITFSLSFDHRVIDGYPASLFLNQLVAYVENPYLLLK